MEWGGGDAIQPLPMRPSWATPSLFCFIRADFSKIRGPLFSSPWNPFCMDLFIISLILCVAFYFFFFFNTCSVALFFFFKEWNNDTIFSIFTEPGKKAHQTEQYSRYFRSVPFVRPGPHRWDSLRAVVALLSMARLCDFFFSAEIENASSSFIKRHV